MGRVSTRGGRKQSAGVLREMKTQSEDCTQRARAAPAREGGFSWGAGGEKKTGGGRGGKVRMSLQEEGIVVRFLWGEKVG